MRQGIIYGLFIALILLVGCSGEEEGQEKDAKDNKPREEEQPEKTEPVEETFENVYPLTGIGTNEDVNNRIVSVMINNHTKARPQTGLSKADIVFEILAEGRITRFLAMFQSELPDVVGPVRSAREYYFDLANRYNALYVYHGAAGFIDNMIVNRGIEFLNGAQYDNDGHLFKRESFRQAPHNSYLLTDAVYEVAEQKGYDTTNTYDALPFLDDDEMANISGNDANHVEIVYSDNPMEIVEFDYDQDNEAYTRFNDREKTIELETEVPIQVENIFIIEAHHQVIDDQGRRAINLEDGGNAYLVQQGKVQQLQWENQDGQIIATKDGQPVGFVPGQTWVNVVPSSPGIDESVTITNE
ncbi:DUF3048 domain-containing protein [Oceanobacillus halotolerans]|uniref:DUF3048 domain-containing protein n=1 Tax=Oceanobacillus halotolerans TaxID=2663380 RepID=UPI0013D93BD6|nr:DUF3048 domain-containing protein [Oceanobacillus halotolerans]